MTRGLGDAWLSAAAAALLATAPATTALAQEYPSKPVVIIVPAAAGGPTDTLARNLGVAMGSALGQQMIIDNSGGAGGIIGINKAAKSRPDGYTVLLYHIGMSTAPALYRKLPYDTVNDFEYIGQVADVPMTLVAKKEMSPNSFGEFLAYAKANQSTLTYANAGIGSASYLCGLLFMSTIQADFTTVPYKGTGPAMTDLVGGRVDFMCDQTTNTTPQIKAGTIKVYGVTSKMRVPSLPDVPTLEEEGLKGFALVVWNGLFAPKFERGEEEAPASLRHHRHLRGGHPDALVRGQLGLPGHPQARRAVLPGERRALQDAARDMAAVRADLPRPLHRRHDARASRRARPGRRRRQSGGPHVLALAADLESVRAVPPGIERGRHVPDYRWNVPRSAALLHP